MNVKIGSKIFRSSLSSLPLKQARIASQLIGKHVKTLNTTMTQEELNVALTEIKHHFVQLIKHSFFHVDSIDQAKQITKTEVGKNLFNFTKPKIKTTFDLQITRPFDLIPPTLTEQKLEYVKSLKEKEKVKHLVQLLAVSNIDYSDTYGYQRTSLRDEYDSAFENTVSIYSALANPTHKPVKTISSVLNLYPTNSEKTKITIDQAFEVYKKK